MILEIEVNDDEHPEVFATVVTPGEFSGGTGWGYSEESALAKLRSWLEFKANEVHPRRD